MKDTYRPSKILDQEEQIIEDNIENNYEKVKKAIECLDNSTDGQFSKEVIGALETTYEPHPDEQFDPVNKPRHYNSHPSGIECIQIARHHSFAIGSAIKYLWRQGLKDGESNIKDLKKAIWYIIDEIQRLGENTDDIDLERHGGL